MDDEQPRRPTVVALMAEYGPFLWNRSPGRRPTDDYAVDPAQLGVSPELVAAMTGWNDRFQLLARDGSFAWDSPEEEQAWLREGLDLAHRLQHELGPDVEVLYHRDGDERPVADRRGR